MLVGHYSLDYVRTPPLCDCRVRHKRGRIRRVNYCPPTLAILAALSVSLALSDDFKTLNGKEYKKATVSRVEPDGITLKFSGGIVKIPFVDLPEELKQKYHYNPDEAWKFAAAQIKLEATQDRPRQAEGGDWDETESIFVRLLPVMGLLS